MAVISLPGAISSTLKTLNLGNYTSQLKNTGSSSNSVVTGKALDDIQATLNQLVNEAKKPKTTTSLDIFDQEVNLDSSNDPNPTLITAKFKADSGEILMVFVNQDNVGNHSILWDPSTFGGAPPTYVDPTGTADVSGTQIRGNIDGANNAFVLPSVPVANVVIQVNGSAVDPTDYQIQGDVLVLAAPPPHGALLEAAYDVDAMTLFLFTGRIDPYDNQKRWFYVASFPSPGDVFLEDVFLTTDFTINADPEPNVASLLVVSVYQDGTGGHAITWGTGFDPSASTAVDSAANSITRYLWIGHTDFTTGDPLWFLLAASGAGGASGIFEQEVALTGDTTINANPTAGVDEILGVFITQDSSGAHDIAWGTGFESDTPTAIDRNPNALTVIQFMGRLDPADSVVKWFWTSNSYLQSTGGGALPIIIGLDDDTLGTNVVGKWLNIVASCTPIHASISVVGQPTIADTIVDILWSTDYGDTWTSIFPIGTGLQLTFPQLTGSPPPFPQNRYDYDQTLFTGAPIPGITSGGPNGSILRVDVLQSGGATGLMIEIDVKAA